MRFLSLLVCLSMLLSVSSQQRLSIWGLDANSHERSSTCNAADSAPLPCPDTVRAAKLQRLWLGDLKSRHTVAGEPTAPLEIVAGFQLLDGEPLPAASGSTLLSQHVRLQL